MLGFSPIARLPISSVTPLTHYSMAASSSSFAVTANDATLALAVKMPATVGTFTLTRIAATLAVKMPAAVGTFTLIGSDATISKGITFNTQQVYDPTTGIYSQSSFSTSTSASNFYSPATTEMMTNGNLAETGAATEPISGQIGYIALDLGRPIFIDSVVSSADAEYLEISSDNNTWFITSYSGYSGETFTSIAATARYVRFRSNISSFVIVREFYITTSTPVSAHYWLLGQSATFTRGRGTLIANTRAFTLTGRDAAFKRTVKTPVTVGTFTLTTNAALFSLKRSAVVGAFTLTGNTVAFKRGIRFTPEFAEFTLTGQDVTLAVKMPAAVGTFTLTGVVVRISTKRSAGTGTFTLTGNAVVFRRGYKLRALFDPNDGVYSQSSVYAENTAATVTGMTNGVFNESYETGTTRGVGEWVKVDLGVIYPVTEVVIGCDFNNTLIGTGGWGKTYTENKTIEVSTDNSTWTAVENTGIFSSSSKTLVLNVFARYVRIVTTAEEWLAVTEFYARVIFKFSLTGQNANLKYSAVYLLSAGTFTFTGYSANLTCTRALEVNHRVFVLTGKAVIFRLGQTSFAATESFVLAGNDAALFVPDYALIGGGNTGTTTGNNGTLSINFYITATTRAYVLTGRAAALKAARKLTATTATFTLTGNSATLSRTRKLPAVKATFVLTRNSAALLRMRRLFAAVRAFTLTGRNVGLRASAKFDVTTGTFTLTGNAVEFIIGAVARGTLSTVSVTPSTGDVSSTANVTGTSNTVSISAYVVSASVSVTATGDSNDITVTAPDGTAFVSADGSLPVISVTPCEATVVGLASIQVPLFNIDVSPCDAIVTTVGYLYKASALASVIPVTLVVGTLENVYTITTKDEAVTLVGATTQLVPVKPRIVVKSETKHVVVSKGQTQLAVVVKPTTQSVVLTRGIVRKVAISR